MDAAKELAKEKTERVEDQFYTGERIMPAVTVRGLTAGKDFEVAGYLANVERGKATVYLRGKDPYSGIKTVNFKIVSADARNLWLGAWDGNQSAK